MNKKMIALAVAGALTAPVAMADVTVYGRVQAELADIDVDGDSARSLVDNAMGRVGVKFSEDLGNGLSAIGKYEFKADTVDNSTGKGTNSALTGRDSYVGLKGSFGQVTFGRNASPYKGTNMDQYIATTLEARNLGGQSSGAYGHASFVSDSIKYTGKFGAVKVAAMIRGSDADGDGDTSFAVDYKGGPLRIVAAASSDEKTSGDDNDRTKVGAQYKMGPWKFTAQVESEDNASFDLSDFGLGTVALESIDYMLLQADYTMGKNTITLRIAEEEYDDGTDTATNDVTMIALQHKFSKKTRAWVGMRNNDVEGVEVDVLTFGLRKDF